MRKDDFTTKCIVVAAIFEDSVSRMIPVAVDKINKMAECGSPRLEVNEVDFAGFLKQVAQRATIAHLRTSKYFQIILK